MSGLQTRLRVGFRSKTQWDYFMVWREYIENGEVVCAEVLFRIGPRLVVGRGK